MKAAFRSSGLFILLTLIVFASISSSIAGEHDKIGWLGVSMQRLTSDLRETMELFDELSAFARRDQQLRLFEQILDLATENPCLLSVARKPAKRFPSPRGEPRFAFQVPCRSGNLPIN